MTLVKVLLKGLLNKIRQQLSSLTLRRVIFAVNGLLGAPFASFIQKRASYSTFTYIPKTGAPNENIVQNHLNIALLNVF